MMKEKIEIIPGIEIIGSSLLINNNTLIIADLHIGHDEALNNQGILIPRIQFNETIKMFKQLFAQLKGKKIKTVVVNGDLKHEFGEISQSEWRETLEVIDLLAKHCERIVLIKGNHDNILGPIARKRNLKIVDYYCIDDVRNMFISEHPKNLRGFSGICVLHGNKILKNDEFSKAKTLIIGHEHPAISLVEGAKVEKYKCFLLGKWKKHVLIVMPSFLPLIEGSDIRKEELLSPYLHQNLNSFKVWILGDKVYEFGKLKDIR